MRHLKLHDGSCPNDPSDPPATDSQEYIVVRVDEFKRSVIAMRVGDGPEYAVVTMPMAWHHAQEVLPYFISRSRDALVGFLEAVGSELISLGSGRGGKGLGRKTH